MMTRRVLALLLCSLALVASADPDTLFGMNFASFLETSTKVSVEAHAEAMVEAMVRSRTSARYEYAEHHDIARAAWSQYLEQKYPEPVITAFDLDLSQLMDPKQRPVSQSGNKGDDFTSFSYPDLVALAGDIIGIWNKPIADSKLPLDKKAQNFMATFDGFISNLTTIKEQQALWKVRFLGDLEKEAVNQRIEKSESPSLAYKERVDYVTAMLSRASENKPIFPYAAWMSLPEQVRKAVFIKESLLTPNRFMDLALHNYDHFAYSGDAQRAYVAAHKSAIEVANQAFKTKDQKLIIKAFAMNAFADHFLTDMFASGHITTPRLLLAETCPVNTGNLLAECMHAEDNQFGVIAQTRKGDKFLTYGDKRYFDGDNADARLRAQQAVFISIEDIQNAIKNGGDQLNGQTVYRALEGVPFRVAHYNVQPMFRAVGQFSANPKATLQVRVPFRDRESLDYLTVTPENKDCVCLSAVLHCRVLNPQVFYTELYEALDWVQGMLVKDKTQHHCATPDIAKMFRTPVEVAEQTMADLKKAWDQAKGLVQQRYQSAMDMLNGALNKMKENDLFKKLQTSDSLDLRSVESRTSAAVASFGRSVTSSAKAIKRNILLMLGGQQLEPVKNQDDGADKFT